MEARFPPLTRTGPWPVVLAAIFFACNARAGQGVPDRVVPVAAGLAIILIGAKIGGHVAVRLGQLAVLGELLMGVLLGNLPGLDALRWLREDAFIDMFARIGALVLLFDVGLELTVRDVTSVGRTAAAVAVVGTLSSFVGGGLASALLNPEASVYSHVFTGAALTATSIGITARVLRDLGKMRTPESRVVLGAAVIDDVIGLVLLALVVGSISGTSSAMPSASTILWTLAKAVGFFAAAFVVGSRIAPAVFSLAARLKSSGAQVALGLSLCFLSSWAADAIGLAPIVGAFTAGLILEDAHYSHFVSRGERSLRELVEPVSSFLVPVFFVLVGARVNLRALASGPALGMAALLTLAAIVGKLACVIGASRVRRLPVAIGMIPRGEVTLTYASIGASIQVAGKPVIDGVVYAALVFVVLATTLVTPAGLRWTFLRSSGSASTDVPAPLSE